MSTVYCIISDESGVFDNLHDERFFVFGGLILNANAGEVSKLASLYKSLEDSLRKKAEYKDVKELKANTLSPHDKRFIFSQMHNFFKFSVIIDLASLHPKIFTGKKSKQRYQDYAYKIGVKRAFEHLIRKGIIEKDDCLKLNFFVDQHHTARMDDTN